MSECEHGILPYCQTCEIEHLEADNKALRAELAAVRKDNKRLKEELEKSREIIFKHVATEAKKLETRLTDEPAELAGSKGGE